TISIDTKKKELVGNFHNRGQEWAGIIHSRRENNLSMS
ncbi:MAG: hypothetical protein F6K28_45210, partial [Microcoleus sp. SIO2G3]|nr:hypothetical protein [Microcoleus sp. SIO2G3]